jgi:GGDEF domain-containing protein
MTFSHDGLRDHLTHLAAPPYFYENLRREISSAARNKSHLALVRFLLIPHNGKSETIAESEYELAILGFAEIIKASTRGEDLCARLGKSEFTLILKAENRIACDLAERVLHLWEATFYRCHYSVLSVNPSESPLEILNRLDNQPLLA